MADKKTEKERLMEQVFGKNAPNRKLTSEDMEGLAYFDISTDDLSPEIRQMVENSKKLQQQAQALSSSYTDSDFEKLKEELRKDFGDSLPTEQQEQLTIVHNQMSLNEKFEAVEKAVNAKVLCQKKFNHSLVTAFRRPTVMGVQASGLKAAVLLWGPVATGRHTALKEAAASMSEQELINKGEVSTINMELYTSKDNETTLLQDLYKAINKSQVILFDNIDKISAMYLPQIEEIVTKGTMTLSKRYIAQNNQLVENTNALVKDTINSLSFKGKYVFFITTLKVSKLMEIVGTRFINAMSDVIATEDITPDNIMDLYPDKYSDFTVKCLENLSITVKDSISLKQYLQDNFLDSENAMYLVNFFNNAYNAIAQYKLENIDKDSANVLLSAKDNAVYLNKEPLSKYLPNVLSSAKDEVRKELDNLVGLKEIKEYVLSLEDFYEAQKLREKQGMKTTEVSKHMIFTGNPGTGKTTIARLIAKYLKAIGVLSNGQLIEVSRNDLVGRYMGHTAPQTMQVIKSALGGILFIDEAYSLYRGTNDSFGLEAIDTLVKAMEDNRDDLIVILAGYTREMQEFLNSNSGLASRFPNQIEFPDYTGEELYEITVIQAKSKGYKLAEETKEPLIEYFTKVQATDSVRSGNGRLARNIVEDAIIRQSKRIVKDPDADISVLELSDLDLTNRNKV